MSGYNKIYCKRCALTNDVSILVLVDVRLQLICVSAVSRSPFSSFNPCFSGCQVTTGGLEAMMHDMMHVSILVLVDVRLQPAEKVGQVTKVW